LLLKSYQRNVARHLDAVAMREAAVNLWHYLQVDGQPSSDEDCATGFCGLIGKAHDDLVHEV
jgi:hypothetical protein